MSNTETKRIYRQLGISEDVWIYGQKIEEGLKERFAEFDSNAEYNQSEGDLCHAAMPGK